MRGLVLLFLVTLLLKSNSLYAAAAPESVKAMLIAMGSLEEDNVRIEKMTKTLKDSIQENIKKTMGKEPNEREKELIKATMARIQEKVVAFNKETNVPVKVFSENLTKEEVELIAAFYKGAGGRAMKKMVSLQPKVAEESKKAYGGMEKLISAELKQLFSSIGSLNRK